jgi:hypothetical protein
MLEVNSFDSMLGQLRESSQLHSGSVLETLAQRQKNASTFMLALTKASEAANGAADKLTDNVVSKLSTAINTASAENKSSVNTAINSSATATAAASPPMQISPPPASDVNSSNQAQQNTQLVNSIAQARAIAPEQQNVIDPSLRSNYTYSTQKDPVNNTLWELEDGLRRATDSYDAAVANAKGGMSRSVASKDGRPVYVSRDQEIQMASEKVQLTRQNFETHKAFLNDPVARNKAEIAFQITRGYPSQGGPELSVQDQLVVKEQRMLRGLGV